MRNILNLGSRRLDMVLKWSLDTQLLIFASAIDANVRWKGRTGAKD